MNHTTYSNTEKRLQELEDKAIEVYLGYYDWDPLDWLDPEERIEYLQLLQTFREETEHD